MSSSRTAPPFICHKLGREVGTLNRYELAAEGGKELLRRYSAISSGTAVIKGSASMVSGVQDFAALVVGIQKASTQAPFTLE